MLHLGERETPLLVAHRPRRASLQDAEKRGGTHRFSDVSPVCAERHFRGLKGGACVRWRMAPAGVLWRLRRQCA